ncbi:MAG: phosphate signaling complex protein PhoU [Thermoplasmata archaeon]|nr:phosphate signaling complex protein PhoU [Thermoplasmata archaeon]
MTRMIENSLNELSAAICEMGELAYKVVSLAVSECISGKCVHQEVREISNRLVAMEEAIEEKVVEMIARYQPVASDLRRIKSSMKIAYDFARFGRYALDISFTNKRLNGVANCDTWIVSYIMEMGEKTLGMMRLSLDSLKKYDPHLVEKIAAREHEIDKMYFDFFDRLIEHSSPTTRCTVSSVLIVRYLERIADHTTYLCKSIVYMETGEKVVFG